MDIELLFYDIKQWGNKQDHYLYRFIDIIKKTQPDRGRTRTDETVFKTRLSGDVSTRGWTMTNLTMIL